MTIALDIKELRPYDSRLPDDSEAVWAFLIFDGDRLWCTQDARQALRQRHESEEPGR